MEWQSVWDSLKAAIHENDTLGSIEKFHHLKSLLGGEALLTVEGLQLTGTNYVAALKQLEEQFNIPELIIAAYFKQLDHLPAVRRSSDGPCLRHLYLQCQGQIDSLNGLGVKDISYGAFPAPHLLSKIPSELQLT